MGGDKVDDASDDDASIDSAGGEEGTDDTKRRERLEQNRISARESRKRKKNMIEELQRTVITLSRENKELNERNETLRRDLVEIGTKGVVNIQALMSCTTGSTPGMNEAAAAALPVEMLTSVPNVASGAPTAGGGSNNGSDNNSNPQAAQNQQVQNALLMQQMFAMNPSLMGGMTGLPGMMGGMGGQLPQQQDQQQQQQQANSPK